MLQTAKRRVFGLGLAVVLGSGMLAAAAEHEPAVEIVADQRFTVVTPHGSGQLPIDLSLDWDRPQPQVKRAVVIFHGKGRDVDGYYRALRHAAGEAGGDAASTSLLVAPQFLNEEDAHAHHLPKEVLRWRQGTWEAGIEAVDPAPLSAYEVIDALVAHLSDRRLFPNLEIIVLAGHSGGGQAMQRYAVVGRAERLVAPGIRLRYVVANPSSFVYFTPERPVFKGDSISFAPGNELLCRNFDRWKYGFGEIPEEYVRKSAAAGVKPLEDAYAAKDVVYLLGTDDTDPQQKDLDITCAGEMEGPTRMARGRIFYAWLHRRHPQNWRQHLWLVPGVGHSGPKMVTSECGVAALFERSSCQDQQ